MRSPRSAVPGSTGPPWVEGFRQLADLVRFWTGARTVKSPPAIWVMDPERAASGAQMLRRTKKATIPPITPARPGRSGRQEPHVRHPALQVRVEMDTPKAATMSPIFRSLNASMPLAAWQRAHSSRNWPEPGHTAWACRRSRGSAATGRDGRILQEGRHRSPLEFRHRSGASTESGSTRGIPCSGSGSSPRPRNGS